MKTPFPSKTWTSETMSAKYVPGGHGIAIHHLWNERIPRLSGWRSPVALPRPARRWPVLGKALIAAKIRTKLGEETWTP